jgi:hypothetical protein
LRRLPRATGNAAAPSWRTPAPGRENVDMGRSD